MSLQSMRRRMASKKTINVILWVLILGFIAGIVIMSMPPDRSGSQNPGYTDDTVIATVGKKPITAGAFAEAYAKRASQVSLPPDVSTVLEIRSYVFDELVRAEKEQQLIDAMKLRVQKTEIREVAQRVANAMISDARVRAHEQYRIEMKAREEAENKDNEPEKPIKKPEVIIREQLSSFVTENGGKTDKAFSEKKFIHWFVNDYAKKSRKNKGYDNLQEYAKRQIAGDIAIKDLPVSPLDENYAKKLFTKEIKGSLILITAEKQTKDRLDAAKKLATEIREKVVQDPTIFAAQAREHSDDTQTKTNGGSLGWVKSNIGISADQMMIPIEYLLYSTEPNAVSPVMFVSGDDPKASVPIIGYAFVKVDEIRDRTDVPESLTWAAMKEPFMQRTGFIYRRTFAGNYMTAEAIKTPVVRKTPELLAYEAKGNSDEASFKKYAEEVLKTTSTQQDAFIRSAFAYQLAALQKAPEDKVRLLKEALPYAGRELERVYIDLGKAYLELGQKEQALEMFSTCMDLGNLGSNPMIAVELYGIYKEMGETERMKSIEKIILGKSQ